MKASRFFAKFPILGLSFVLAITLYLFVQVQNSPKQEGVPVSVKINVANLSNKYYAYVLGSLRATIDGPTDAVKQFQSDNGKVNVSLNLAQAKIGTAVYLAKVEALANSPLRVTLSDHYVQVRVVPMSIRTNVKVNDVWTGQMSASSEFILSDFELKPDRVTLRGPEDQIGLVQPTITIDLNRISSSSDFVELPIQVLDKKGALAESVTALPAVVEASPILMPKPQLKQVVLNVQFTGHLSPGLALKTWTITPQAVTVHGASEALAKLVAVSVTVDLAKLTNAGWNQITVAPDLPKGITLAKKQLIAVRVQLDPQPVPTNPTNPTTTQGPPSNTTP